MSKQKCFSFITFFVLAATLGALLSGCALRSPKAPASAGEFRLVTSFYPIYIATINITKDVPGVVVENLTQAQTGCLHDYQLKPQDLITIDSADVFVTNGAGMEAFLGKVIDQRPALKVIDASAGIKLLKDQNGIENPHVWVSVTNAITQVRNIAEQLASQNPANAQKFASNAAIYEKKLLNLKDEMDIAMKAYKGREIITFHEAFPYFAQEFGLKIAAVIEREPGVAPTPQQLEQIILTVRATGIKALFAELQYSAKAADVIALETGATVYNLDPIVTGQTSTASADEYIIKMRQNLQTLEKALGN